MANPFNATLNITEAWFLELGNQTSAVNFFTQINESMNYAPAIAMLLIIAGVIILSLWKDAQPKMDAICTASYVVTVVAFFFRLIPLVTDFHLIACFFITGICIYIQIAHKPDFE